MFSLISEVVGIGRDWLQGKRELAKAETENKARLLREKESHNSNWEMESLRGKDKWLRRISFSLLSFPVVMSWFDPERVSEYFTVGLAAMPDWYIQAYVTILGVIWGVTELKRLIK